MLSKAQASAGAGSSRAATTLVCGTARKPGTGIFVETSVPLPRALSAGRRGAAAVPSGQLQRPEVREMGQLRPCSRTPRGQEQV